VIDQAGEGGEVGRPQNVLLPAVLVGIDCIIEVYSDIDN